MVKAGDLLFTIDRRPFQTALCSGTGWSRTGEGHVAFAESDLARAQGLTIGTVITQQTFDQRTQAKRVAEASVAAQQLPSARRRSTSNSPSCARRCRGASVTGRVSIGNLVTGGTSGNTSLLCTIESIDPIRFEFTLD